jgi:hypothetical protein
MYNATFGIQRDGVQCVIDYIGKESTAVINYAMRRRPADNKSAARYRARQVDRVSQLVLFSAREIVGSVIDYRSW